MSDAAVLLPSQQVAALSPEARAHWQLTGNIDPKAKAPAPDAPHAEVAEPADPSTYAESSPAEPAEQAPEIAGRNEAASEPATPKKKPNAETRIQELLAKTKAQDAEIARLKAESKPGSTADVTPPAAPSAATEPKSLDQFVSQPDLSKPRLDEVEFFAQFPAAKLADYQDYRENYAESRRQLRSEAEGRTSAIQNAFQDRIKSTLSANPQLWDTIPHELKTAKATGITLDGTSPRTAWNDIAAELVTSESAGVLLSHFSAHPDELHQIAALPTDKDVTRAMARLEARLTTESVNPNKVVRPRTTTSAPDPQSVTLGRNTQGVVDDAAGAIARKDTGAYIAIMNRRETAGPR